MSYDHNKFGAALDKYLMTDPEDKGDPDIIVCPNCREEWHIDDMGSCEDGYCPECHADCACHCPETVPCPDCGGSGKRDGADECARCDGTGEIDR